MLRELGDRKRDGVPHRSSGLEVQRGQAAVDRGVVILDTGRDAEKSVMTALTESSPDLADQVRSLATAKRLE